MQIEHKAIIKEIKDNKILATITTQSACLHCQVKGACNLGDCQDKDVDIVAQDTQKYYVGQEISVGFSQGLAFLSLFLGYILPLIIMLSVFVVAKACGLDDFDCGSFAIISLIPYYLVLNSQKKSLKRKFEIKINDESDLD